MDVIRESAPQVRSALRSGDCARGRRICWSASAPCWCRGHCGWRRRCLSGTSSRNFDIAWSGFDVALAVSLIATGYGLLQAAPPGRRASPPRPPRCSSCDAWFDVLTSAPGAERMMAVAMAVLRRATGGGGLRDDRLPRCRASRHARRPPACRRSSPAALTARLRAAASARRVAGRPAIRPPQSTTGRRCRIRSVRPDPLRIVTGVTESSLHREALVDRVFGGERRGGRGPSRTAGATARRDRAAAATRRPGWRAARRGRPSSAEPTRMLKITASGEMSTPLPMITGCRTWFSSCW